MNWRKRKKLRKIAHAHGKFHYYEWRFMIKALCYQDLYLICVIKSFMEGNHV